MKKKTKDTINVTADMLDTLKVGDPIARYCFFVNLTFQGFENDKVVIMDINGDKKKIEKWLFLKYAEVKVTD